MNFSEALELVKQGKKISREGWNGKGIYVELQRPDANSKMKRPYLYITPCDKEIVPWVPGQSDLLRDDWMIIE